MGEQRIQVTVDRDLEDLIPAFMQRRHEDVQKLHAALEAGDLETLRVTGHSMKGTGGGFGFHALSEIGATLEAAARASRLDDLRAAIERLEDYLARVEVRFE